MYYFIYSYDYVSNFSRLKKIKKKIEYQLEKDDQITLQIMNKLNRQLIYVYLGEKKLFQFFHHEEFIYKQYFLFDKLLIIEYISKNYFIFNLEENYKQLVRTKYKISNFMIDISNKSLNAISIIFLVNSEKRENKKNNAYHLKKYNFNKFTGIDQIVYFTKIMCPNETLAQELDYLYEYNTFYEFNNSHFIIMNRNNIFLFEKFSHSSVLIQTLDITFSINPYLKVKNNLYLISSEHFIYKIDLIVKNENSYSIFKDMTLNFNNEKYKEVLEAIKIIIYYNIEIDDVPFSELKNCMRNIFQEYDIFNYVGNLSHTLNEENIILFLSYNLNSSKLFVIFIFCIIFENLNFITNIFKFILLSSYDDDENIHTLDNTNILKKNKFGFNHNLLFMSYLILFEDFISLFFKEFTKINLKDFKRELNKKIFEEFDLVRDNCKNNRILLNIINKYLETNQL